MSSDLETAASESIPFSSSTRIFSADSISSYRPHILGFTSSKLVRPTKNLHENHLAKAYSEWGAVSVGMDAASASSQAKNILSGISFSYDDLLSFIVSEGDCFDKNAASFISQSINRVPEKYLVFNLQFPVALPWFWEYLPSGKILLDFSLGGSLSGYGSEGSIVTYAKKEGEIFFGHKGLAVVCAPVGRYCGHGGYRSGCLINLCDAGSKFFLNSSGLGINLGTVVSVQPGPDSFLISLSCIPDIGGKNSLQPPKIYSYPNLIDYLLNLKSVFLAGRSNPKVVFDFIRSLGPYPSKAIRDKVDSLVPDKGIARIIGYGRGGGND